MEYQTTLSKEEKDVVLLSLIEYIKSLQDKVNEDLDNGLPENKFTTGLLMIAKNLYFKLNSL